MKITALEALIVQVGPGRTWTFIEVHTDAGLIGIGEASQSRLDVGVAAQVRALAPLLIGKDPLTIREQLPHLLSTPWHNGRVRYAAVSGIDQALWDLSGKALGVPCYQLLGGKLRDQVRLYANINLAAPSKTPSDLAATARVAVDQGFSAIKINLFDSPAEFAFSPGTLDFRDSWDMAIERVRAVRNAISPDVDLLTDWIFAVPPNEAANVADSLAEFNLFWIEEPANNASPDFLATFRQQIRPRLAAGEQLSGIVPFHRLLENRALDVIMPDVKWCGGLLQAKKIATLAEVYNVEVSPHNMSGPVSSAASVQLCANIPNFLILEYCWGVPSWRQDLIGNTETIVEGHMVVPDTPGLGIDWVREVAKSHSIASV